MLGAMAGKDQRVIVVRVVIGLVGRTRQALHEGDALLLGNLGIERCP